MSEHLNRLDDKGSYEFDRLYKIFCETGKWCDKEQEEDKEQEKIDEIN